MPALRRLLLAETPLVVQQQQQQERDQQRGEPEGTEENGIKIIKMRMRTKN
jgi:hypothetical protein